MQLLTIMDRISYLLKAAEQDEKEKTEIILNTWAAMGEITVNKHTKVYSAGQLILIKCDSGASLLHNRFIYVQQEYIVNNRDKLEIDWSLLQPDDINGLLVSVEGVSLPYFVIIGNQTWNATFTPDYNFIPYQDSSGNLVDAKVNINDDELELCLIDIGMPWLSWDMVEYSKTEIINLCVRPAMHKYFSYFPIIKSDGSYGQYGTGAQFEIEMPENAYGAIPYYVNGIGGSSGGGNPSPFNFWAETSLWSGGGVGSMGSRYGKGVYYPNKQTPGFTGQQGRQASMRDNLSINQNQRNYMRQEHYETVRVNGKKYIRGFSTTGGQLNIKWLCQSKEWDDIQFDHLETIARPLVRINTLNAIESIRSLVKADIPGQLDLNRYSQKAKELEEIVKPLINASSTGYLFAIMRSGSGQ